MKLLGLTVGAVVIGAIATLWPSKGSSAAGETDGHRGAGAKHASPAQAGSGLIYHGVALQLSGKAARADAAIPLVREIAALGADTILLSPAAQMEHARAQAIFMDMRRTATPEEMLAVMAECRKLGLRIIVMPVVLLSHPRGSEWRGVIEPPEWDDWWRQYRDFIKWYADIAQRGGAEVLMVGSELVSTEKYTSEWLSTIGTARSIFKGKLSYSANWDHYEPIKWWDKLDLVAMTSYYTLAEKKNPSVDDIVRHWNPIRDKILEWQRKVGKPIIFTEVGWCSQEGAGTAPWNYYQNTRASKEGLEEQRRLYEAFIQAWKGAPGLAGVIWWEWTTSDGGPSDFDYTPKGKPAEQTLRRWFAEGAHSGDKATTEHETPEGS